MRTVTAKLNNLTGYIEKGHIELTLSENHFKEFQSLSDEDKKEWLNFRGVLVIDSYSLTDEGDIDSSTIKVKDDVEAL